MTRDQLIALLQKHRDNDLTIRAEIFNADPDAGEFAPVQLFVTGVAYDPRSDRLCILACEMEPE